MNLWHAATLDKVIKGFTKKSIEQLGVIKETNSLVALSGKLTIFQ